MEDLVLPFGYGLEVYYVTTDDGYVLGTYRIPGPRPVPGVVQNPPRRVVLLQHGLLDSSATWALEPDTSLAFMLADRGWDVWMGNSRGNAFSRNHTGLDPRGPAFWSFSLDDMASRDLPALVHFIRNATGVARLAYVGHSQGATIALAGLASSPELRDSFAVAALLAPAASLRHIDSVPMRGLAALRADELFALLGVAEFMPNQKEVSELFEALCRATPEVCISALTAICGFNAAHVNTSRLWHYVAYAPSGTSTMNMEHWAQMVRAARAAPGEDLRLPMYDWGNQCESPMGVPQSCNRRVYGSDTAPVYDVGEVQGVPLALFWGGSDKLAGPMDVAILIKALRPGIIKLALGYPEYEHLDFVWATTARTQVYPAVLRHLEEFWASDEVATM